MTEVETHEVRVAAAPTRWRTAAIVTAALLSAVSAAWFWLSPPEWGFCVDGETADGTPWGYCDTGVFWSNAVIGTIVLLVALLALVVTMLKVPDRRIRATAAFAVALIAAWLVQALPIEETPIPWRE